MRKLSKFIPLVNLKAIRQLLYAVDFLFFVWSKDLLIVFVYHGLRYKFFFFFF